MNSELQSFVLSKQLGNPEHQYMSLVQVPLLVNSLLVSLDHCVRSSVSCPTPFASWSTWRPTELTSSLIHRACFVQSHPSPTQPLILNVAELSTTAPHLPAGSDPSFWTGQKEVAQHHLDVL